MNLISSGPAHCTGNASSLPLRVSLVSALDRRGIPAILFVSFDRVTCRGQSHQWEQWHVGRKEAAVCGHFYEISFIESCQWGRQVRLGGEFGSALEAGYKV